MLIFSYEAVPGNEHELMELFVDCCSRQGSHLGVSGCGALSQFFTYAQAITCCKHLNEAEYDARREHISQMDFTYVYVAGEFAIAPPTEAELKSWTIAHDKLYQRNDSTIKVCNNIVAWMHRHMTPEQIKEMDGDTNVRTLDFRVQGNLFFLYLNRCVDRTVLALGREIALAVVDPQLASAFITKTEEAINRLDALTGETTSARQRVNIFSTGLAHRLEAGGIMNVAYHIFVDAILKENRTKMSITLPEFKGFVKRWEIQHPLVATAASVMGVNAVTIPILPGPIGGGKSQNALKRAARKAKAASAAGAIGGGAAAPVPAPIPPAAKLCTGCNKAGHLVINCFGNPDNENLTIAQIKAKK